MHVCLCIFLCSSSSTSTVPVVCNQYVPKSVSFGLIFVRVLSSFFSFGGSFSGTTVCSMF